MSVFNVITLEEEDIPGAKLNKAPSACSLDELKRWLQCHGQKRTGNKREIVSRVEGFISLKTPVDPKVDGGKWYTKKQLSCENLGVPEIVHIIPFGLNLSMLIQSRSLIHLNYSHPYPCHICRVNAH